jgi:GTP-binding protein HflX
MDKKNAVVISLNDDVSEIIDLAGSIGYNVVKSFIQHRESPDVKSYIGIGKVEDIEKYIDESDYSINLVIVDGELKPSQWFFLEKIFDVDVYDRVRLILAIFTERADRREARLQVKLAQLEYERPFVRELIHRARSGEHPGFMAGGEYQVDDYYEMIKKQVKKIKKELEKIREGREVRRGHRHKSGFYLVSLAGYTNAGKSSLLNVLSGEKVKVDGRLFSTLSTTTRRIKNDSIPILLTDTVGFIQDLPAWVIDAFHSTLEEIEVADVVVLVVDISEPDEVVARKLKVASDELVEIGVKSSVVIAFNKIDKIPEMELNNRIDYVRSQGLLKELNFVNISVKNNENIGGLLNIIYDYLPYFKRFKIKLPVNDKSQSFVSWIYDKARVCDIVYKDYVTLTVECNSSIYNRIVSRCEELKGSVYY